MSFSLISPNPLVLPPRPKAELEIDIPTLVKTPLINNSMYLLEEGGRETWSFKRQTGIKAGQETWGLDKCGLTGNRDAGV